jgi:purine-nucleoside phosphorylase
MTIITTAMYIEAKVIIEAYQLKQDTTFCFDVYKNDSILLIVTGIGIINSSIATTYIINKIQNISHIYNIGIAGCSDKSIQIGSIFLINKINDICQNKYLYPDIILKHHLKECDISTFAHIVTKDMIDNIKSTLVDMEASSFFLSAIKFINLHKISILKITSDHLLEDKNYKFSKDTVIQLIENNINNIKDFISNYKINTKKLLSNEEEIYIKDIQSQYKLSFTTKQKIYQYIKYIKTKNINNTLLKQDINTIFKSYL